MSLLRPAATSAHSGIVRPDNVTLVTDSQGVESVVGKSLDELLDIATLGGPALSDILATRRAGNDYKAALSALITLANRTQAGERVVTLASGLTTVTLTATDHNKNLTVLGSLAGTLVADGTISSGFRVFLENGSTGVLTYGTGVRGLLGTTSLAAGATGWAFMSNAEIKVSAGSASAAAATSYSQNKSATTGLVGAAVTITYAPISGTWPSGITLTPAVSGIAGTFSPTTASPTGGSSNAVSVTFTPSAAGTATLTVTSGGAMTNPASTTYAAVAVATAYTTSFSSTSGNPGSTVIVTFTPNGGWPAGEVITPTQSGVTGTFSPTTVSTTAGSTQAVSTTFTPSTTGTAAISSTTSPSLTNTTGSQNYTVGSGTASAYSLTQSATSGMVGLADTLTLTPTGGAWPANTISISVTGATNTLANGTGGSLSGNVLTPPAGTSTTCTVTMTPSATGTLTIAATNSGSMTNPSNLTYTATAAASSYTTSLSAASGTVNSPVTVTFTPDAGWPSGETITPTTSALTGTFSPTTLTPTAGSTAAVTCTFTPTAAGSGTINSTTSPALTNASGAQAYAATSGKPAYPTLTTSAASRFAVYDGNVGLGISGGSVTSWADNSGNGHDLTAIAGAATVGANVNGWPGVNFTAQSSVTNPGLSPSGSTTFLGAFQTGHAVAFAVQTKASSFAGSGFVYSLEPSDATNNETGVYFQSTSTTAGDIYFLCRQHPNINNFAKIGSFAQNTLYKIVLRWSSNATSLDVWINGVHSTVSLAGVVFTSPFTRFQLGQNTTWANYGFTFGELLEWHGVDKALNDADCATYASYLTSVFG